MERPALSRKLKMVLVFFRHKYILKGRETV